MSTSSLPLLTLTQVAVSAITACRFVTALGAQAGADASTLGAAGTPAAIGEAFSANVRGTTTVEAGAAIALGATLKSDASGAEQVHGLTTAAGLWLTAAIGMACGMGLEVTALIATALALVVFALVPRLNPSSEQDKAARPEWRDTDSG